MQSTLNLLYSTIKTKKKKERFETILEPLQAILQIGYLSFSPIGTKLTIRNNILQIQTPNYSQSVVRWYNNDTQEDLFYLFNIFYRFKKFYHFLSEDKIHHESKKLYDLLIELAKSGINNLIRTYSQTDKIHILHTLQLYKNILEGGNNIESFASKRLETFEIDHLSNSPASHASRSSPASFTSNTKKYDYYGQHPIRKNYICSLNTINDLKKIKRDNFMINYYASHPDDFLNPYHNLKHVNISLYSMRPDIYGAAGVIYYISNKSCKYLVRHMESINYDILRYDNFTKSYPYIIEDCAVSFIMYLNGIDFINSYLFYDTPLHDTISKHTNKYK